MKKYLLGLGFISLISLLLTACVPPVSGLYQAPSFTYGSIYNENIGIGGVASAEKPLRNGQRNLYANLLRDKLMAKYPGINVMPVGDTIRALGARDYYRMMREYRTTGVINDNYLRILKTHIHHLRYLAFARITQKRVTFDTDQADQHPDGFHHHYDYDHHYHYHYHHHHGHGHVVTTTITLKTNLNMRAEMSVYDLATSQYVWTGNAPTTLTNTNTIDSREYHAGYDPRWGDIIADIASNTLTASERRQLPYPQIPSARTALSQIFDGLVYHLPRQPKQ